MDEHTYDIGTNTQQLGFAYLFFRYVWPVIINFILLVLLGAFMIWFLRFAVANPIQFIPTTIILPHA